MAKENVTKNINMDNENFVPVKPAQNYKVPYVTDPIEFMVYGDRSLQNFNSEVKRVEAELRREIYHQEVDYPLVGDKKKVKKVKKEKIKGDNKNSKKSPKNLTNQNKQGKKVNVSSLFAIICGLLILVMSMLGRVVKLDINTNIFAIAGNVDGLSYVINIVQAFINNAPMNWFHFVCALSIAAVGLISVITIIAGAICIVKKGTGIGMKFAMFLRFIFAVLIAVMQLVDKTAISELTIGLYAVLGLSFISLLVSLCSRSKVSKK